MESIRTYPVEVLAPFEVSGYMSNPDLSNYSQFLENLDSTQLEILNQYTLVTGAYNKLWEEIYKRTVTKSWKADPNGIGSCSVSDELSLSGVPQSTFKQNLIALRKRVNNQTPPSGSSNSCPSHRSNTGCVIGPLKGPLCLDYEDLFMKPEIEKRFGLCLMPIKPYLQKISLGKEDEEFALNAVFSINNLTEYIKSFPILEED